jgi:hypothetical protein
MLLSVVVGLLIALLLGSTVLMGVLNHLGCELKAGV